MKIDVRNLEQCENLPIREGINAQHDGWWNCKKEYRKDKLDGLTYKLLNSCIGERKAVIDIKLRALIARNRSRRTLSSVYEYKLETESWKSGLYWDENFCLQDKPYTGNFFWNKHRKDSKTMMSVKDRAIARREVLRRRKMLNKRRKMWLIPATSTIGIITQVELIDMHGDTVVEPKIIRVNFFDYMFENNYSLYCGAYKAS